MFKKKLVKDKVNFIEQVLLDKLEKERLFIFYLLIFLTKQGTIALRCYII